MALGRETVYVLERVQSGTDAHGNPTYTHAEPGTAVLALFVEPSRVEEQGGESGRETVITPMRVGVPDGTEIAAVDRMKVRGHVYEVDGEPELWVNPFTGSRPGIRVALRRVEG